MQYQAAYPISRWDDDAPCSQPKTTAMTQHIKTFEAALSPELCAEIIARFDADLRVQSDPQPDYSTRHYLNASLCREWRPINVKLCSIANELTAAYFARPPQLQQSTYHEWGDDGYIVSRYDVGDTCIMHIDGQTTEEPHNGLRIATLLIYLNDVPSGGETCFPMQNVKIKPVQGRALMFPVGYTHPHEVVKATSKRYIVQTWITHPSFVVNEFE